MLPVFPPSLPVPGATDAIVSVEASKAWRRCVERLRGLPVVYQDGKLTPAVVRFTPAAQHKFNAFLDEMAAEINAPDFPINLRAPWMKLRGYSARLALILQSMRDATGDAAKMEAVNEVSVRGAVALVDYFKTHIWLVSRQLPTMADDKVADRVCAWMRKRGTEVCPRDVGRAGIPGIRNADEAEAVLDALTERGLLTRREREKGKPVYAWKRYTEGA